MRLMGVVFALLFCAGCAGGGGSTLAKPPVDNTLGGFKIPATLSAPVPPNPPAMTPPKATSHGRRTSSGGSHPAFFAGETALANGVYYLALPNGNVFGYYSYLADPTYIYHFDMGYEYMSDPSDGHGGIYFYDTASGHWWYTSRDYPFPYLYDFTLAATLYYYPDTQSAGHYTTNPRYFYNFATSKIITLPGTVVWQTGGGTTLGQYVLPAASDGQCAGVGPAISGSNASFTMLRNTNATYNYDGTNYSGSSTCWRNQMNPIDPSTGTNFMLDAGMHYTYYFKTVVTLNGNTVYKYLSNGGLGVDIPAIVWQTHSYGENPGTGPCDILAIGNTYVDYANGMTQYGVVTDGGKATWSFHTCSDSSSFSGNSYNSPDTLYDGEVDSWQIDITAQLDGHSGGSVAVKRNGTVVYNAPSGDCDSTATNGCWWNFGPYMFYWENSGEPPGWNNAGVNVQVNNMTLVKQ